MGGLTMYKIIKKKEKKIFKLCSIRLSIYKIFYKLNLSAKSFINVAKSHQLSISEKYINRQKILFTTVSNYSFKIIYKIKEKIFYTSQQYPIPIRTEEIYSNLGELNHFLNHQSWKGSPRQYRRIKRWLRIRPRTRLPLYRKPLYVHSSHALIPWKAFFQRGARSPRNQRRTRGILSTKTMADIRAPVPSFPSKSHSSTFNRLGLILVQGRRGERKNPSRKMHKSG